MPDNQGSNRFLAIGGILCAIPGFLLWLLPKLARTPQDAELITQAIGEYGSRNLGLEIFLWCVLFVGIGCLIYAFKLRFPNPEDIQFEEEWEKKGR